MSSSVASTFTRQRSSTQGSVSGATPRTDHLIMHEIIRLGEKGRRVLAGEDSWTALMTTFNKSHGMEPADLTFSDKAPVWPADQLQLTAVRDLVKVLHVTHSLLQEGVAMQPPSPATYSSHLAPPSHITILLTTLRVLYNFSPLTKCFHKHQIAPLLICLTGGIHSPEALACLHVLAEVLVRPHQNDRQWEVQNKRHAFDNDLSGVLEELLDGFQTHFATGGELTRGICRFDGSGYTGTGPDMTCEAHDEPDEKTASTVGTLMVGKLGGTEATLRLLLELLCSLTNWRKASTPAKDLQALRQALRKDMLLLFDLTRYKDDVIRYRACLLLKTLLLDSEPVQTVALQYAAVNYGLLLWQLRSYVADVVEGEEQAMRDSVTAVATMTTTEGQQPPPPQQRPPSPSSSSHPTSPGHRLSSPRGWGLSTSSQLAVTRDLIVLICMENDLSYETMTRALPLGIVCMRCAEWTPQLPSNEDGEESMPQRSEWGPMVALSSSGWKKNLEVLEGLARDWVTPELIWNAQTRAELLQGLDVEVRKLDYVRVKEGSHVAWDIRGFEVDYPSYRDQLLVDGFFVDLLVDALRGHRPYPHGKLVAEPSVSTVDGRPPQDASTHVDRRQGSSTPAADSLVRDPVRLLWHLFDRCVAEENGSWRMLCLRAMRLLIMRHPTEVAGLVPIRFILLEIVHVAEWHRAHTQTAQMMEDFEEEEKGEESGLEEDHVEAERGGGGLRLQPSLLSVDEEGMGLDLMTDAWLRELLLLLLSSLESCKDWRVGSDLVREAIRYNCLGILMDLFWYCQSLILAVGKPPAFPPACGFVESPSQRDVCDAASDVTVDCDDDYVAHSIFSIVLHIFLAMTRFTPATNQLLYQCQALPRLGVSLWVLGHLGPLAPYADEHAVINIVRLLDRLLMLAPDFRPALWESAVFHYLLCGCIDEQGSGILRTEVAEFFRKYHVVEVKKAPTAASGGDISQPSSWLEPFLPRQMVRLLIQAKPEVFVRVFNGDVENPGVIWGSTQRLACLRRASGQVREAIHHLFEDPGDVPTPLAIDLAQDEDLYPELTERPQVMDIYLQELLHSSPEAFLVPIDPQDFLQHLISPINCMVKPVNKHPALPPNTPTSSQPVEGPPPGEHLPHDPLDRALLLMQAIQRVLTFWPIHYPLWASTGLSALTSLMDWVLAQHEDPKVGKDGTSRRLTTLGACCMVVLQVIDPLAPRDNTVEFGRMHLRSPGTVASPSTLSPTTRNPAGLPIPSPHGKGSFDDLSQSGSSAHGLGGSSSSSGKIPTPVHAQTMQCMDRFIDSSGLSLTYEVLSMALKELLPRHHDRNNGDDDGRRQEGERQGQEACDNATPQVPHDPPISMMEGTFRLQGQASIHRIISNSLFIALLLFKFGSPRRDFGEERYRGREYLRLIIIELFLMHRDKTHLNNMVVGLTVVEALLTESALRRAFVDFGGLIVVPKLICDLGGLPSRRTSSVVDVRHIAYGLLDGDYCPSCFYDNQERESCCRMMVQFMAFKAVEVLWTCASRFRGNDSVEIITVVNEARAVLRQLLTPGLLATLTVERSASRFLATLFTSGPVKHPYLFWYPELLTVLQQTLEAEASKIIQTGIERSRWPLWSSTDFFLPDAYRSLYPSLQEELVVNDLFLAPMLEGNLDFGPAKQVAQFLEALEVSIQSSHSVLQHLTGRSAKSQEEVEAITRQEKVLSEKQTVLDAVIRKYPEHSWRKSRLLTKGSSSSSRRKPVSSNGNNSSVSNRA